MNSTPRRILASSLFLLAATLILGSCATRLPPAEPIDVLGPLSPGALAYVEARGDDIGLIARKLEASTSPERPKLREAFRSVQSLAARGRLFGLALLPEASSEVTSPDAAGAEPSKATPNFEAAIAGDFDAFGLWLNFVGSRGWRQSEGLWQNRSLDLGVALPRRGLLVAAKGDARALAARAKAPGAPPLPEAYAKLVDEGLVIWIPDPIRRLGPGFGLEGSILADQGLPTFDLLLIARTDPLRNHDSTDKAYLDLDAAILPREGGSARLLLPAIRLGWYFLGDRLPFEGKASFKLDGDSLRIAGLRLPLARLSAIVEKAVEDGEKAGK